jgi:hypothetical protein
MNWLASLHDCFKPIRPETSTEGAGARDTVSLMAQLWRCLFSPRNVLMRAFLAYMLTGLLCGAISASAGVDIRQENIRFDKMIELHGIKFHVTSTNDGSINTLNIVPTGLTIDNTPIVRTIDGTVTGAEVADLNVDGSPEIYIYVTSAGSGSYGSLVAYSANRRKSLSEIHLPSLAKNKKAAQGYMGHDEFAVIESVLARRFPIYRNTDTNAKPTGGMRQLHYKLFRGEAGWVLRVDRVVEY